jgi:hypothetical protein
MSAVGIGIIDSNESYKFGLSYSCNKTSFCETNTSRWIRRLRDETRGKNEKGHH